MNLNVTFHRYKIISKKNISMLNKCTFININEFMKNNILCISNYIKIN